MNTSTNTTTTKRRAHRVASGMLAVFVSLTAMVALAGSAGAYDNPWGRDPLPPGFQHRGVLIEIDGEGDEFWDAFDCRWMTYGWPKSETFDTYVHPLFFDAVPQCDNTEARTLIKYENYITDIGVPLRWADHPIVSWIEDNGWYVRFYGGPAQGTPYDDFTIFAAFDS